MTQENSTLVTDLKAVRELVATGWCQGPCARDKHGRAAMVLHDSAASFCLYGAVARVTYTIDVSRRRKDVLDALGTLIPIEYISDSATRVVAFNEERGRTQAEVVALVDRAIQCEIAKATNLVGAK